MNEYFVFYGQNNWIELNGIAIAILPLNERVMLAHDGAYRGLQYNNTNTQYSGGLWMLITSFFIWIIWINIEFRTNCKYQGSSIFIMRTSWYYNSIICIIQRNTSFIVDVLSRRHDEYMNFTHFRGKQLLLKLICISMIALLRPK